jgi:hypothetical protein
MGMPPPPRSGGPPVINFRNTSSPHWRGWLKPKAVTHDAFVVHGENKEDRAAT